NTIEDGVLVADETGRVVYFNQAVTRLLGMQEGQSEGQHVNQFRRLKNLQVTVDLGSTKLTPALAREIDALGPVRKTIALGPSFTKTSLDRLAALKNIELLYDARAGDLSAEDLSMLADLPIVRRVLVRSTLPPAEFRRFEGMKNVVLVVEVDRDTLQDETATVLSALKIPVVLRVSDTLDDEKYRALFILDGFSLEVTPVSPDRIRQRLLDMLKRTDP
ncbi:MAG: PAS domain-containing protein, partial [candidate division Zixibacteria bacterium]|nr:PAS domain-containing protein [candidate division Zixibacteria bacterium]